MHVITKRPFVEAARQFPHKKQAIMDTYRVLEKGTFNDPHALSALFPSLDNFKYREKWWVINIGGNELRLIACILFKANLVYVKHIVTHADYDKLTERYRKGEL